MTTPNEQPKPEQDGYDYIIVGSGAGGAPLAARLVENGKRVLVIEAGSNHANRGALDPGNEISRVPLLHAASTEHKDLSWRYFIEHYERNNDGRLPTGIAEDPKRHNSEDPAQRGIFYPRATGVGGCTIHNAMITIAGPDSDWDDLADFLRDDSWRSSYMRGYFQRLEHNDYHPAPTSYRQTPPGSMFDYAKAATWWLFGGRPDLTGGKHGFRGWLHTSVLDLSIGLDDKQLIKMLKAALWQAKLAGLERAWTLVRTILRGSIRQALDPNHSDTQAHSPEGIALIPVAVFGRSASIHQNSGEPDAIVGRRSSPREFLLKTQRDFPERLTIATDCLVTKILLDNGDPPRAVGVELLCGERLYRAHVEPNDQAGRKDEVRVRQGGEVILAAGSFNTPQLLMLSGIGDSKALAEIPAGAGGGKPGIPCLVDLPGVGKNLQDRYEVSVVSEMRKDFSVLEGATFRLPDDPNRPDRHLARWRAKGTGLYAGNGAVLAIIKRSLPELPQPDLFIFGIPSQFRGYEVGYSAPQPHNLFTWVILKSHTKNRDGYVKLRSTDPRDTPVINFNSFSTKVRPGVSDEAREAAIADDPDLQALLHGVKFVRGILKHAKSVVSSEIHPGTSLAPERNDARVKDWIRRDAWGHHACGSCRMGPDDDADAVVDSRFRVRGVAGLRIVDASIFPKIPGYFIVTNIYMASEKAADVILQDAERVNDAYPTELRKLEAAAIDERRAIANSSPATGFPLAPKSLAASDGDWNDDVAGLACSGGGIRSGTFCLGVLQSLARHRQLRRFDFLSTVSGGGYIGSFLGRFYDRLRPSPNDGNPLAGGNPADVVEGELTEPGSYVIEWLRRHGNYITPQGSGDGRLNFAIFVRNLLSVHLVVGIAIFGLFGLANLVRYGLFDRALAATAFVIDPSDFPLGSLMQIWIGPFFSPWFILVDVLLLFLVLPRMIGYWIVSQDKHEEFKLVPLLLLFIVAGTLLLLGVRDGLVPEWVIIGVALLTAPLYVELAWNRGRYEERAAGIGNVETQRLRTRNYLTYDLGLSLALAGGALVFAVIDTFGHGLQEWKIAGNMTYAQAFSALFAAIAVTFPAGRWLAGLLADRMQGPTSTLVRLLSRDMAFGLLAAALFTLPLILYSFTSHVAYAGGAALRQGAFITLFAVIATILLALPSALAFVNRSSLAQTYSARLARAYLGASNPLRRRPDGMNVTEVIRGDDVASITDYRPHAASGPLHIINLTVNQTVDKASLLRKRDRQGDIMAVSCLAVSVGEKWHGAWQQTQEPDRNATKVRLGVRPLGQPPGTEHPLVDALGRSATRTEPLSLRQWIGISGAAIDSGRGHATNRGLALLFGMTNLRTGHWWDSGISASSRFGFPNLTFLRRVLYLIPRVFSTQCLLLREWIARYPGPWERYWHLSDGGFFEDLGGYELVRRRLPRIFICDAGADPSYEFTDLAELIRKVNIDFSAKIESFSPSDVQQYVPAGVQKYVGTFDDLKPIPDRDGSRRVLSTKHAALFWVQYPGAKRKSVILYLKSSLTGDEPADVQQYQRSHPEFPHEATADQFFDEAQWESYRALGEYLSNPILAPGDTDTDSFGWFWRIPL